MKFSIKNFFSKKDQTRRKLRNWSHLPKISLVENFIFCAVAAVWKASINRWFRISQDYKKLKAELVTTDFTGFIDEMLVFINYSLGDSDSEALEKALEGINIYQAQIFVANNADTEMLVEGLVSTFA